MAMSAKDRRALARAALYLSPNLAGFLVFTLVPLIASLVMAFTNWDLKQHNMFHEGAVPRWVGLENFALLLREDEFLRYLGNTLIMMLGIPFGMGGSLLAALMLNGALKGKTKGDAKKVLAASVAISVVSVGAVGLLTVLGLGGTALTLVIVSFAGLLIVGGAITGSTTYRTIFYLPSFTSGVAIFLLWKKIYNPTNGPLNNALEGPLLAFSKVVAAVPDPVVQAGLPLGYALVGVIAFLVCRRLAGMWDDGELGIQGVLLGALLMAVALGLGWLWRPDTSPTLSVVAAGLLTVGVLAGLAMLLGRLPKPRPFTCPPSFGLGTGLMIAMVALTVQATLLGLSLWMRVLPEQAAAGIAPPYWLVNYHWAKPALILMGLWAAIGSNNMLLYLAGLSGVPQTLYDAASIDGAKGFTRFWHVTWPQLAPVTFFIFVMSMIGGLQGGFEMAKTMTNGGPAGSTTTLAYYIFTEGFETGRLGFASAVAWAMFALVFAITAFNWKFGSQYTSD